MKFIFSAVKLSVILAGCVGGISQAASQPAQNFISGAVLQEKVVAYLATQNINAKPKIAADRQFIKCKSELLITPLFGSFRTVEVRCPDAGGWKIAVRTNADRKIISQKQNTPSVSRQKTGTTDTAEVAVTMRRSVKRGAIISADDVQLEKVEGFLPRDIFTQLDDVIGRIATQKLDIGKPVRARQLEHNWMVRKDQPVELTTKIGGVQVSSQGIALEDAQWGQLARFLNVGSQREVFGRVASEKKIIIGAKIY